MFMFQVDCPLLKSTNGGLHSDQLLLPVWVVLAVCVFVYTITKKLEVQKGLYAPPVSPVEAQIGKLCPSCDKYQS